MFILQYVKLYIHRVTGRNYISKQFTLLIDSVVDLFAVPLTNVIIQSTERRGQSPALSMGHLYVGWVTLKFFEVSELCSQFNDLQAGNQQLS